MKYRVLLVDDEPLIVESLKSLDMWDKLDCEIVGMAYNGAQGMELFRQMQPDLVVTDMVMPQLTGLEMLEQLPRGKHPFQVIVLSAYDDFAYAQGAMAHGVMHYVLKPIDTDKLQSAVEKCIRLLQAQKSRQAQVEDLQSMATQARQYASTSMLFDIARYGSELSEWEKSLLMKTDYFKPSVIIMLQIFNIPRDVEDLFARAEKFCTAAFAKKGYDVALSRMEYGFLFVCPLDKGVVPQVGRERIVHLAKSMAGEWRGDLGVAAITISDVYRDFASLHAGYMQCSARIGQGFFCRTSRVLEQDSVANGAEVPDSAPLLHELAHGNTEACRQQLEHWCAALACCTDRETVLYSMRELYRKAGLLASQNGMHQKPEIPERYLHENFWERSRSLDQYLAEISRYIGKQQTVLGKLELLIEENYSNSELNLTMLAEYMGVNSSYLSRLFKKEFGENFLGYLLRVRVERAQFLLRTTHHKSREISRMVGFEDPHYFSQVFKKHCGMTPSQYREQMQQK